MRWRYAVWWRQCVIVCVCSCANVLFGFEQGRANQSPGGERFVVFGADNTDDARVDTFSGLALRYRGGIARDKDRCSFCVEIVNMYEKPIFIREKPGQYEGSAALVWKASRDDSGGEIDYYKAGGTRTVFGGPFRRLVGRSKSVGDALTVGGLVAFDDPVSGQQSVIWFVDVSGMVLAIGKECSIRPDRAGALCHVNVEVEFYVVGDPDSRVVTFAVPVWVDRAFATGKKRSAEGSRGGGDALQF